MVTKKELEPLKGLSFDQVMKKVLSVPPAKKVKKPKVKSKKEA